MGQSCRKLTNQWRPEKKLLHSFYLVYLCFLLFLRAIAWLIFDRIGSYMIPIVDLKNEFCDVGKLTIYGLFFQMFKIFRISFLTIF